MDTLYSFLHEGSNERRNLDAEGNYVNHDCISGPMPLGDNSMDGILASHFFEHFNCQDAVKIMGDCLRVLRPKAPIVVSVPNASYFRKVHDRDNKENSFELFGEQITPQNPNNSFFDAALWFNEHFGILTEDSLWCYLVRAGFNEVRLAPGTPETPELTKLMDHLNRPHFSLVMTGVKA
jgi:hypothetical protein